MPAASLPPRYTASASRPLAIPRTLSLGSAADFTALPRSSFRRFRVPRIVFVPLLGIRSAWPTVCASADQRIWPPLASPTSARLNVKRSSPGSPCVTTRLCNGPVALPLSNFSCALLRRRLDVDAILSLGLYRTRHLNRNRHRCRRSADVARDPIEIRV